MYIYSTTDLSSWWVDAHGEGQRFCHSQSYSPLVEAWTGSIAMCATEEVFSYSPQPPKE